MDDDFNYYVVGTLAEYAIATASHAIPLPDSLSYDQAARKYCCLHNPALFSHTDFEPYLYFFQIAILCAGVTAYKALKETEASPGEFVTIIGAGGGLGHLAIQYAVAMGLRVIAMDVGDLKLKYCASLGAEFTVDASSPTAVAEVILNLRCRIFGQ